jgi:hypothetical protein
MDFGPRPRNQNDQFDRCVINLCAEERLEFLNLGNRSQMADVRIHDIKYTSEFVAIDNREGMIIRCQGGEEQAGGKDKHLNHGDHRVVE